MEAEDEAVPVRAGRYRRVCLRIGDGRTAKFIAGGTNLLDLMKLQIETPTHLVDIGPLPLAEIEETAKAACASARELRTAHSPPTCGSAAAIQCYRRRSRRARRRSFATRPRPAGICFSARGAPTSMTRRSPATSECQAPAAQPGRPQPHERGDRGEQRLHRRTRVRHGGCDGGAGRAGGDCRG